MPEKVNNSTEDNRLRRDPRDEVWENWQGAVLLRDEIREYCKNAPKLIDPFVDDRKFLKPASYHLRLGDRCRVNGEDHNISKGNPVLKIPPHGIAVVRTLEKVNIPGFLVARWNLKVKKVYKGLVWVGSLQVDPGYSGYLFCPLYNLSNEEQRLEYGETLFTIDFVRTTKGCELWAPDPSRPTDCLGALDTDRLKSAPKEQFDRMRTDIENMKSEIRVFQTVTLVMLTVIVTALTIIGTLGATGKLAMVGNIEWLPAVLSFFALPVALIALLISIFKFQRNVHINIYFRKKRK
jgi:deoxycytidine triphosphate deaminase